MAPRSSTRPARRGAPRGAPPHPHATGRERRNGRVDQANLQRAEKARRARRRKVWVRSAIGAIAAASALVIVFLTGGHGGRVSYAYQVGHPGPGAVAPAFTLASNTGGSFSLGAQRGKTVLLFFQEGTDCQPCWKQLQAIQHDRTAFHRVGIDEVVSITTDPLGALEQAAQTYGTTIPVLSDPTLTVSHAYHANDFGMMGTGFDGHTFVVVGPTGRIEWRADYGGAPNYTMYVPDSTLLSQMRASLARQRTA